MEFGNGKKRICLVGCLHGNEVIGMKVINRLRREGVECASVKAIIANERAISIRRRFVDTDGNRCFPGKRNGNVEERMAYRLLKEIEGYDYVIDIHSTHADMADTVIVTKRKSLNEARLRVPIKNIVLMGREIAKGHSLIDFAEKGISLEFYKKRSVKDVSMLVRQTIENIGEGKRLKTKKEVYRVTGFIQRTGRPFAIRNYRLVRKGQPLMKDGPRIVRSEDSFYPIFFGERGYKGLCMKSVKE